MRGSKLIIFDLDGTLADAYSAIIESFNYVMHKLSYPGAKPGVIRKAVGWGDENLLRPFVKAGDLSRAVSIYRRHHKTSLLRGARLFPKTGRLLAYLKKKGYIVAVASNRPTRFSRILIRHLKIAKYFDYVLCADRLRRGKPHPEILDKIRRHFGLRKDNVLYVGDMAIDAQAARRAGIKSIMVTTGSSTKKDIAREKPYLVIHKLERLLKIL